MQSQNELRNLLQRIDHKSYPAYKDTRGSYDFGNYVLSIDHVQGDPFAAPSKVSVHVRGGAAKFPADLYRMKCRKERTSGGEPPGTGSVGAHRMPDG